MRGDNNDKATKTSEWTRQMSFGFHQQSIPCEAAKGIQSRRMVVHASLKMLGRPSEHRLPLEGKGEDGRGRGETWHSDNTFPARCVRPAGLLLLVVSSAAAAATATATQLSSARQHVPSHSTTRHDGFIRNVLPITKLHREPFNQLMVPHALLNRHQCSNNRQPRWTS